MPKPLVTDELWNVVEPLLPEQPPKPKGGRPRVNVAVRHSAANVHDSRMLATMLDAVSPIRRPRGRPRKRPEKLHADKAYDFDRCREALRQRGIAPRIARRGLERTLGTPPVDSRKDTGVAEPLQEAEGAL